MRRKTKNTSSKPPGQAAHGPAATVQPPAESTERVVRALTPDSFTELEKLAAEELIQRGLQEDLAAGDLTSETHSRLASPREICRSHRRRPQSPAESFGICADQGQPSPGFEGAGRQGHGPLGEAAARTTSQPPCGAGSGHLGRAGPGH